MFTSLSPASGESMLTGSPQNNSFASPSNLTGSGSPKAPFLPPYLLGPTHFSTTPENQLRNFQNYAGHFPAVTITTPGASHHHHHVTWSPELVQRYPPSASATMSINRLGGPPTRSLEVMDGLQKKEQQSAIPLDRLDSSNFNTSPTANMSASQIDPFYTQGDDFDPASDLDDTWVTVFGFTPDAANYILKEFSMYGTIVQHEFASKGNWVHIRYQSAMQARKALAKNGHLYAQDTIRIGVSPCIDKDVMRRFRRKNVLQQSDDDESDAGTKRLKTSGPTSRLSKPTSAPVSSLLFTRFDTSTPVRPNPLANVSRLDTSSVVGSPADNLNRSGRLGSMRSLAAAYDNARPPNSLNQSTHQAPVNGTNGNMLTKAWKYIFSS